MKKYRLLKDLPFAKAGDIFKGELEQGTTVLFPEDYDNYKHKLNSDEFWDFDEWFEEVKQYFLINILKAEVNEVMKNYHTAWAIENMKSLGLLFETKEEAEKHLEYLKAKEVIKQDTKGFKPGWNAVDGKKYYGIWDFEENKPDWRTVYTVKGVDICFENWDDINESFKKHAKEWETYLTYEQ